MLCFIKLTIGYSSISNCFFKLRIPLNIEVLILLCYQSCSSGSRHSTISHLLDNITITIYIVAECVVLSIKRIQIHSILEGNLLEAVDSNRIILVSFPSLLTAIIRRADCLIGIVHIYIVAIVNSCRCNCHNGVTCYFRGSICSSPICSINCISRSFQRSRQTLKFEAVVKQLSGRHRGRRQIVVNHALSTISYLSPRN